MIIVTQPDAEAWLIGWIKPRVSCPVTARLLPDHTLDKSAVVVVLTGGRAAHTGVFYATLTVDCYGPDKGTASDLAARLLAACPASVGGMVNGALCVGCDHQSGPYWTPDPDTGQARYRLTFSLLLEGKQTTE